MVCFRPKEVIPNDSNSVRRPAPETGVGWPGGRVFPTAKVSKAC